MMKRKPTNYVLIPDTVAQNLKDHEFLINELLSYFKFINNIDFEEIDSKENLPETLDELREEFSIISQTYGKLRNSFFQLFLVLTF